MARSPSVSRHLLIACSLSVALATFATPARAETSGALVLRGFVPTRCDIEVGAAPAAGALPLQTPQSSLVVASVRETCNSGSGYSVEVSSRHDGRLAGSGSEIAYRLEYGEVAPDLAGSHATPVTLVKSPVRTGQQGVERVVRISHAGAQTAPGGSYEDTLTFTIRAK